MWDFFGCCGGCKKWCESVEALFCVNVCVHGYCIAGEEASIWWESEWIEEVFEFDGVFEVVNLLLDNGL